MSHGIPGLHPPKAGRTPAQLRPPQMCPNVSGDTCPLAESRGFSEGQEVPAREGLSWTRTRPPGLLLVPEPLRPFEAAGLLGPRTAQLPLGSPGLWDAVLLGPRALALCLCQRRRPPGCPLQLQTPPSPRPDPPRLPDVAPDPVGWVSQGGEGSVSEPCTPAPGDGPRQACSGPAHLVEHRREDVLVAVHVDAPTDAQKLLLVLGLGLLEGLQLDQQVGVLQVPGARGAGRAEAAAPPWTAAQTPLCGAVLGTWPHPGQWS